MIKQKHDTAGQLYKTLLEAAGDPIVYDTVVEQIIDKFGSDKKFISEVNKELGIPEEVITKEIIDAATLPAKEVKPSANLSNEGNQSANPDAPAPIKPQETPQMPAQAPGLGGPPDIAQPQSAAPPQPMQAAAAQNQAKGMSSGQALNVANQAPKPMMKKGGLLQKLEYGGSVDGGANPKADMSTIGLKDGGDVDEIDLVGEHKPGMLGGGLMTLPNYNNSVEMKEGGTNDPPAGALPEEVADDQPVMLSKGEFVFPANVVRFIGLKALMKIRDDALIGLAKMEEAGQIRRPGDGKNPGEEGEVKASPIFNKPDEELLEHIEEHKEIAELEEDPDDLYLKSGGSIANLDPKSTLAMKTAHLRHSKNYGNNSALKGPNNLSQYQGNGGPNEPGMASGGILPPDNTTGIDPMPIARRNAATPEGRGIGRNMGKRPFKQNKGSASVEGKGVYRPFDKGSRKMAEGGDVENSPFEFKQDNPSLRGNTQWIKEKQADAERRYSKERGISGTPTGWIRGEVDLSTDHVSKLEGARFEKRGPGDPKYDGLLERVKKEGWKQDKFPILVEVNHKGEAYITEGNTRTAIARDLKIPSVKAEVKWLNGGETVKESEWSPDKIKDKLHKPTTSKGGGGGNVIDLKSKNPWDKNRPLMAQGGDVNTEQAGKYLNERDANGGEDRESHRDSLAGYENFGDFARAIASTPNIFSMGIVADAIRGNGLFNQNWNSDYLTTGELRSGQSHIGKALDIDENATIPEYNDAKNKENNDDIMNAYGGNSSGATNSNDTSSPEPGIGRDE